MEIKIYSPGTFCWADLATTDAEAAKKFYSPLFGWKATDVPAGEAGTYTMLEKDGKPVCALYGMDEQMCQQGVPPHWQSYVSVKDADETAAKVTELGGTVIQPPFDVMDVGRMAIVQDPAGATFALWQPRRHIGAQRVNEPGTLCWNELCTGNTAAASRFYVALFGWTEKKGPGTAGPEYTEFRNGDRPAAGMIEIQKEWGEVPPHWSVYFAVADCDAALEKAKSLGAKVEMPPMEVKDVGRFALLQDPQGAHLAVIHLTGSAG